MVNPGAAFGQAVAAIAWGVPRSSWCKRGMHTFCHGRARPIGRPQQPCRCVCHHLVG